MNGEHMWGLTVRTNLLIFNIEMKLNNQHKTYIIGNESLKEDQMSIKLKELKHNKDYVIVPPRVWKAFTAWYGQSYEIKRKVIKYPIEEKDLTLLKKKSKSSESKTFENKIFT